jgi:hypothetical protein
LEKKPSSPTKVPHNPWHPQRNVVIPITMFVAVGGDLIDATAVTASSLTITFIAHTHYR